MTRPRLPTALFTVMNGNLPRPSLLPSGMTLTSSSSSQSSSIVLPINRRMIDLNRHFDRLRRRIAFFFCGSLDVVADAAPLVWLTGVGRGRSVGLTVWHCTLARPADPPPPPLLGGRGCRRRSRLANFPSEQNNALRLRPRRGPSSRGREGNL